MVEVKVKVLLIEEEKAEKSNFMNRYLDLIPKELIRKRDERNLIFIKEHQR